MTDEIAHLIAPHAALEQLFFDARRNRPEKEVIEARDEVVVDGLHRIQPFVERLERILLQLLRVLALPVGRAASAEAVERGRRADESLFSASEVVVGKKRGGLLADVFEDQD